MKKTLYIILTLSFVVLISIFFIFKYQKTISDKLSEKVETALAVSTTTEKSEKVETVPPAVSTTTEKIVATSSVDSTKQNSDTTHADLLMALKKLHTGPSFNNTETYPPLKNPCSDNLEDVVFTAQSSNILFTDKKDENTESAEASEFHVYDEKGNHTGSISKDPYYETTIANIRIKKYPGIGDRLTINESFNGKIVIVGKKTALINVEVKGNGGSCDMASVLLPISKNSELTIPITSLGDIGPMSYDINGDKKEDLIVSFIHPLLPEKEKELYKIMGLPGLEDVLKNQI